MALTCEMCGSTNFVKDDGMLVCQDCGLKYTVEEAQRMAKSQVARAGGANSIAAKAAAATAAAKAARQAAEGVLAGNAADPARPAQQPTVVVNVHAGEAQPHRTQPAAKPRPHDPIKDGLLSAPERAALAAATVQEQNNVLCAAWQRAIEAYDRLEHPVRAQFDRLLEQAKECAELLDAAAKREPEGHPHNQLIYQNILEIEDCVQDAKFYKQDDEGAWKSDREPLAKLERTGAASTYRSRLDYERQFVVQEYAGSHPDEWGQRSALQAEADRVSAELGELQDEKRSHGLFDFSGKREVKERMAPVKEELAQLQSQVRAYDRAADAYVDERLEELGRTWTRLRF